jgi:hypothetical protein
MPRQAAGEPHQRAGYPLSARLPAVTSGIKVKKLSYVEPWETNHEKITHRPRCGLDIHRSFGRHRARTGHRYPA